MKCRRHVRAVPAGPEPPTPEPKGEGLRKDLMKAFKVTNANEAFEFSETFRKAHTVEEYKQLIKADKELFRLVQKVSKHLIKFFQHSDCSACRHKCK